MSPPSQNLTSLPEKNVLAPLWRRALAFLIDSFILGTLGFALGFLFFDFFARLGIWGRLVGFVVSLIYFGILDSQIGGGQTLGKRLLRIKVVTGSCANLGIFLSGFRFTILGMPYFLNGVPLGQGAAAYLFSFLIVFGLGFSIIYLFLFNRRTKQSVHDLAVGAFVIKSQTNQGLSLPSVWKWHFPIIGGILIVMGLLSAKMFQRHDQMALVQLENVRRSIGENSNIKAAGINLGQVFTGSKRVDYININVWLKNDSKDKERLANALVRLLNAQYSPALDMQYVTVNIFYGFQLGIASASRQQRYSFSPQQWQERLKNMGETAVGE